MAGVLFEDTFDTYSDGDLEGENGGTGFSTAYAGNAGKFNVQGTTVFQGAKAVIYDSTGGGALQRTLTSDISGDGNIVYFAIRAAQTNGGGFRVYIRNTSDQGQAYIQMDSVDGFGTTGNIYLFRSGPGVTTLVTTYSANTWYVIRLTFNSAAGTFSAAYSTDPFGPGGTFSSESSTVNFLQTGNTRYFGFGTENTTADYFIDYISGTSPYASTGPASVKTWDAVTQSTGIKTYRGLALASTKSVMNVT